MVLVSHKYKFIYIKNVKVAGSSCFTKFSKYCNEEDLSKYIEKRKEPFNIDQEPEILAKIYKQFNTEYGYIVGDWKYLRTLTPEQVESYKENLVINHVCAEHENAISLKYLFKEHFDSYFKFCIVRNPYDRLVSRYNHDICKNNIDKTLSFRNYVENEDKKGMINKINDDWFDRCTIHGIPCCDYYIKYDKLQEGIIEVMKILKIDDNDKMPHVNKNILKVLTYHYSIYYDEYIKDIVDKNCKQEIDYFIWEF